MRAYRDLKGGFALPTVLIASVVMMIVLAASVSSVVAVRTALKTQYYEQLAKTAGEAGVAYAKACLAKNGNVPLWGASSNPLTPATDCAGNVVIAGCPSAPGCSVTVNENVRSSFSVPRPATDSSGRAVTISNSGFVELLRASTGAVWRTYRQPSVQSAVVPDLCSGASTTALGWGNAVQVSPAVSIPGASGAATISTASGASPSGYKYFRKDFPVYESGTYNATVLTPSGQDIAAMHVDGALVATSSGSVATAPVTLSAGCHTITVKLNNQTALTRQSAFAAAIQRPDSAPIIGTDSSWRVSSGETVHFSSPDYYADPTQWSWVLDRGLRSIDAADTMTRSVSLACGATCPPERTSYYRDSREFVIAAPTEAKLTSICDDFCNIYLNGDMVFEGRNGTSTMNLTLTPGRYTMAASVYNGGSGDNPTALALSLLDLGSSTVLARTDAMWQVAENASTAGNRTAPEPQSHAMLFVPSPNETQVPMAGVLVVAGGGAGGNGAAGGGGGGGVVYNPRQELAVGTSYAISIGGGGTGSTSTSANGQKGYNSSFGGSLIVANGGGGGPSRGGGTHSTNAGSGGGGAGATAAGTGIRDIPGIPTVGQGSSGGAGQPSSSTTTAFGGGGGGAGGAGIAATATTPGGGGGHYLSYMTGSRLDLAGGGGGSAMSNATLYGAGSGSGGAGGISATPGASGIINTGGGGGAGGAGTSSRGGHGGSGTVIVRVPTGAYTVAVTGTHTTGTYEGFTYYRFTSAGSFRITAVR